MRVLCCAVADGGLEAACAFLYLIEEGSVELEFNGAIQVPKRKRKKQFQHFLFFLCVCVCENGDDHLPRQARDKRNGTKHNSIYNNSMNLCFFRGRAVAATHFSQTRNMA